MKDILTKNFLMEEYVNKKLSPYRIAKNIPCGVNSIRRYLQKYNIPIRNMSESQKNKKMPPKSKEAKDRISKILKGRIISKEWKEKISKTKTGKLKPKGFGEKVSIRRKLMVGEKAPNYKDGRTPLVVAIYTLFENKNWKKQVFEKDHFTCQKCNIKGGYLEVHHIKKFLLILQEFLQLYPQLDIVKNKEQLVELARKYNPFWDISNGKTLCYKCHCKLENIRQEDDTYIS